MLIIKKMKKVIDKILKKFKNFSFKKIIQIWLMF